MRNEEAPLLRAAWERLVGSGPEARAVGEELLDRWGEPHRRHHTVRHLWQVLCAVDVLAEEAADPDLVRLAAWFHDAVHQGSSDDEEQSAALALDRLPMTGTDPARTLEVARLVLVTRDHRPEPGDADAVVLCDADLSVLAGPADEYLTYNAAVRAEYGRFSDEEFRRGRAGVLRRLLDSPHLYSTGFGRLHWEPRARANMSAELERLEADGRSEPSGFRGPSAR